MLVVGGIGERIADLRHTFDRLVERGWAPGDAHRWLADGLWEAHAHRRDQIRDEQVRWKLADPRVFRPPWTVVAPGDLLAYPVRDEPDRTERLTGRQVDELGGETALVERTLPTTLAEPAHRDRLTFERFGAAGLRGDVYTATRLMAPRRLLREVGAPPGPTVLAVPTHLDVWVVPLRTAAAAREAAWAVTAAAVRRAAGVGRALVTGAFWFDADDPDARVLRVAWTEAEPPGSGRGAGAIRVDESVV